MVNLTIMSMIVSMCGGEDDSTSSQVDEVTTKSSTTTYALSKVEVFNEDELVANDEMEIVTSVLKKYDNSFIISSDTAAEEILSML